MNVSKTGYGVDVSSRRADDLEKKLLSEVPEQTDCRILDLGCGAGGAAARLLEAGAEVVGVDSHDFAAEWKTIGQFYQADINKISELFSNRVFDYCLCQRTIHYLPYNDAAQVLSDLRRIVGKKLHISFSGITSEIARGYETRSLPVERRHGLLSDDQQKLFGITAPLTLYSETEATDLLLATGWNIDWVRTSDFGNVRIVGSNNS